LKEGIRDGKEDLDEFNEVCGAINLDRLRAWFSPDTKRVGNAPMSLRSSVRTGKGAFTHPSKQ